MKAVNLTDVLHQTPFRPFEIISDSGKTYRVDHPEFFSFNQAKTVCVVSEGEHVYILDLDQLTGVTFDIPQKSNGGS
jgi:hypothetical protein